MRWAHFWVRWAHFCVRMTAKRGIVDAYPVPKGMLERASRPSKAVPHLFLFPVEPFIQSVLFGSPYSGCRRFSGWPKEPCHKAPVGNVWPPQRNAPGAIICADHYHKSLRVPARVPGPKWGPCRATMTSSTPTQQGHFVICGPSTMGPYSHYAGWDWTGGDEWEVGTAGGSGHNQGLA